LVQSLRDFIDSRVSLSFGFRGIWPTLVQTLRDFVDSRVSLSFGFRGIWPTLVQTLRDFVDSRVSLSFGFRGIWPTLVQTLRDFVHSCISTFEIALLGSARAQSWQFFSIERKKRRSMNSRDARAKFRTTKIKDKFEPRILEVDWIVMDMAVL
jgi:hypothetical protein